MIAHPPAHCCTVGFKHEGVTVGEDVMMGETATYITPPPSKTSPSSTTTSSSSSPETTHGILIIPDVMGHKPTAIRLLADQFADHGYLVVVLDPFRGDPCELNRPVGFDMGAWIRGEGGRPSKEVGAVDPIITAVIKEMHEKYKVQKLGMIGYCFGGKYVTRFLSPTTNTSPLPILAGYTAHPSWITSAELHSIRGPLSVSAAERDSIFPEQERHEMERILKSLSTGQGEENGKGGGGKGEGEGLSYQMTLYSGVSHGFATRADLSDERQRWAKEEAVRQAVRWMGRFVKGG